MTEQEYWKNVELYCNEHKQDKLYKHNRKILSKIMKEAKVHFNDLYYNIYPEKFKFKNEEKIIKHYLYEHRNTIIVGYDFVDSLNNDDFLNKLKKYKNFDKLKIYSRFENSYDLRSRWCCLEIDENKLKEGGKQ